MQGRLFVLHGIFSQLLELIPALDGYVVYREGAEGIDECSGEALLYHLLLNLLSTKAKYFNPVWSITDSGL